MGTQLCADAVPQLSADAVPHVSPEKLFAEQPWTCSAIPEVAEGGGVRYCCKRRERFGVRKLQ